MNIRKCPKCNKVYFALATRPKYIWFIHERYTCEVYKSKETAHALGMIAKQKG